MILLVSFEARGTRTFHRHLRDHTLNIRENFCPVISFHRERENGRSGTSLRAKQRSQPRKSVALTSQRIELTELFRVDGLPAQAAMPKQKLGASGLQVSKQILKNR